MIKRSGIQSSFCIKDWKILTAAAAKRTDKIRARFWGKLQSGYVLLTLSPKSPTCNVADFHEQCRGTKALSADAWSASRHVIVGQGGAQEGPVEKVLRKNGIKRHVVGCVSNFSAALIMASETNALFTTLRAPFEETAKRLGMSALPLPFHMPDAPATLMFRTDYGNPFDIWLQELCVMSLS